MKSKELLDRFKALSEKERLNAVGFLLGYAGMDASGFVDSESQPSFPAAQYMQQAFELAISKHEGKRRECVASAPQQTPNDPSHSAEERPAPVGEFGIPPLCVSTVPGKGLPQTRNVSGDWPEERPSPVEELKAGEQPEQVPMAGGAAASSKIPLLHLIPTVAIEGIAKRMEKGVERKGDKAWNAISRNQQVLLDVPFVIERLSHVIHHAMKLRDKLAHGVDVDAILKDDDAGAIAWGGVFALCAVDALLQKKMSGIRQAVYSHLEKQGSP